MIMVTISSFTFCNSSVIEKVAWQKLVATGNDEQKTRMAVWYRAGKCLTQSIIYYVFYIAAMYCQFPLIDCTSRSDLTRDRPQHSKPQFCEIMDQESPKALCFIIISATRRTHPRYEKQPGKSTFLDWRLLELEVDKRIYNRDR
ncbi:hypothetical protein DICVIV_08965 [Dictyocaulus viviparus]|uniref:Uncharacterized protein n=1 Tax=Dictyocaulus viviparus TaxID=29172 RepID=A0A0D8XKB0_DICVI|nr:hypothetical protein DICVIV_08965 [Dictyocaulus viviparus]